jgi:hypothetical protein
MPPKRPAKKPKIVAPQPPCGTAVLLEDSEVTRLLVVLCEDSEARKLARARLEAARPFLGDERVSECERQLAISAQWALKGALAACKAMAALQQPKDEFLQKTGGEFAKKCIAKQAKLSVRDSVIWRSAGLQLGIEHCEDLHSVWTMGKAHAGLDLNALGELRDGWAQVLLGLIRTESTVPCVQLSEHGQNDEMALSESSTTATHSGSCDHSRPFLEDEFLYQ